MTEITTLKFQLFSHLQTKNMKMGWKHPSYEGHEALKQAEIELDTEPGSLS